MAAILMILLFNDNGASALDLSRAFKKADKDASAAAAEVTANGEQVVMSSEDALANAKKLVNDLNDAATGTGEFIPCTNFMVHENYSLRRL